MSLFDLGANLINGKEKQLTDYKGNVLLIVNTASKCGFTPQFAELQELYEKYQDKGLVILGFPCDQFGHQDPGNNEEIAEFCSLNYGVTFPMFEKVNVNGKDAHPIFKLLTKEAPGVLGTKGIKWNFTKFLVDHQGNVVQRYSPQVKPSEIEKDIINLLN